MADYSGWFDQNEQKEKRRLFLHAERQLPIPLYQLLIGLIILYGLLFNAIVSALLSDRAILFLYNVYPLVLIAYLVLGILGIFLTRSESPLFSFIGYNLVVLPIGVLVSMVTFAYDPYLVAAAMFGTAAVVVAMTGVATVFPNFFRKLGWALFTALLLSMIAGFVFLLLGLDSFLLDFLLVLIFSLYIAFDWSRACSYEPTLDNAVDSACDLYLDIINLFLRLLRIIGRRRR